ncbi:endogenous retrovirus group K member 113 Pol protein-like [Elysia marginata]|uniref:Endogenous retrovirus group K member 113 Pol protein-like n=1 Tax=Elysia marginata TaxID=1093978 RepID=A0AAV4IKB3_9GAST|nr:endogenous retrovirus group K member 113 Pol protein-like [Elysia marginata]
MMRRVHTTFWWPGIQNEVKQLAEQCDVCQVLKPRNQNETLILHNEGNLLWEKIGGNLFELDGKAYLAVVDYYSNFIEIEYLSTTTTVQVIKKLKAMFAR